ncbi:MAG: hypothetical protein K2Y09_05255 [Nitrosomonas sp.]|uniref:YCF48-related protein n=1 Tax=Nitrosomonas sp. TaxID=42353 RepID=UPI001DF180A9|nr:YCF48-related protein [Nitrosomonas sp.]MBX9894573.1 hypothetical protein [Nitrosomonas sp.]
MLSKAKRQGFWLLIVLATVLLLVSSWVAWEQEPHPDAFRAAPDWLSKDFWWYPFEINAFKCLPEIRSGLTAIHMHTDGQRGWAVGYDGTIVHTRDGGTSWQDQASGTRASLNSITFTADGQRGWAVGYGTILHTADGGKSWQEQASWTRALLNSITFTADGERGWAVGSSAILHTEDGGKSWQEQARGSLALLSSVTFAADGERGWAVGGSGTILHTTDSGKNSQVQSRGIRASLSSITFAADGQRGWAAGSGGTMLHTLDGGESWQLQDSLTRASLNSITFMADGQRGWVVGGSGPILHTMDGGKNWQQIAAYRMFPAPWFYLMLLLVLLLYALAFGWRARQIRQVGKQEPFRSVSDHAATDRPVSLGDPDFLGARCIAAGLTRFLTNAKTEPPLTLAITGDWGSGKSSLMNYLFASLKREGLRPVWFNAWHHREEQNVLASILAKVQQQAIKPWWHPAGFWFRGRLWWRRHLLWKTLMLITLFCFFFAMTWLILLPKEKWHDTLQYARYWLKVDQPVILSMRGFETLCPGWTESPRPGDDAIAPAAAGLTLVPGKKPQPASASQDTGENRPVRVNHHFDSVQCQTLHGFSMQRRKIDALNCITDVTGAAQQACFATPAILLDNIERQWEGELLPKDESLIRDALDFLQPDSPVPAALTGWIAAAFAALLFIAGKSMALLGLTSMQFFQTVASRLRGAQQPAEKVGTRLLFEKYFQDITVLLGKRSLVLFIDDLDRCDRDYTRQVLEVTNFLSSSGALFIVIGMAPRYVLANVTLSFQDTAKAVHEADMRNGKTPPGHDPNAGQSWFAQHYLQKLINIEVPVPKPDAGQVKALLKNEAQSQAQEEDRKLERLEKSEKRIDDALKLLGKLFRIALLLGVTGYAIYLAGWGFDAKPVTPPAPESAPSPAAIPSKAPDKTGQTDQPTRDVPERTDDTGNTEREIVIPAPSRSESFVTWPLWTGILAVAFVMLLVSAVYWLIRKQDALNDQRWLWLKPLLKRLKVTLFGPEVTQDTKDFTDALDIWYELIARKDPTPRNIKAFKNHLRYLVSRDNQTPENSREAHLVALATLFYVYPKVFDKLTARIVGSDTISASDFETQWPDLQKTLSAHQDAFGRLPSADDIAFYRRMIQDMQIHRPSED